MAREINRIEYNGRTFYQNDIKNGNMYVAASLLSEQLEINTLEFDLVSDDTSLTNFKRNDKLTYYYDGRQMAIFYLQSVERTGPRMYHFSANSAIGLLTEGQHYGGIYTGQTVEEVLPDILGTVPYIIKSNLKDVKLYGWLPVAQPRDNLSQVLFAIGATVKTDLDGYLRIESFWDSVSSITGRDRIYSGAKVGYTPAVTQVVVTEHQYVEGAESMQLFEGTTAAGDIITFNEPMHSLAASGFTILESGANYAKVSAGSGTLTGKKYIHNTRQIAKTVATAQTPNVKTVESATLISLTNSQSTAERLVNYYKWLETVDAAVVYKGEKPGDRVQIYHPYDKTDVTGCLQSADITLSNVLKAQEKVLVGYVPPMVGDIVTYDHREVLTGNGTFHVPDGVTSVRAVLIGGGTGGQGGYDGEAGGSANQATAAPGGSASTPGGKGGDGGQKGSGGAGGNVLTIDLTIPEGVSSLEYACGAGGTGGTVNGGAGGVGGNTTLTLAGETHSSAEGSGSSIGYVDTQTGETFALPGSDGHQGGKGGDGGTHTTSSPPGDSSRGADGESVGNNAGGAGGAGDYITQGTVTVSYKSVPNFDLGTKYTSIPGTISGYEDPMGFNKSTGEYTPGGSPKSISFTLEDFGSRGYINFSSINVIAEDKKSWFFTQSVRKSTDIRAKYGGTGYKSVPDQTSVAIARVCAGAGGGGAAYNNAGNAATEGYLSIKGGAGASASLPEVQTVFGTGGIGGNGGGGGGGGGGAYVWVHQKYGSSATVYGTSGGNGGAGSPGGAGGPGCIILYYGVPHVISSGWLKTRDGKYFNDRFIRRFVV